MSNSYTAETHDAIRSMGMDVWAPLRATARLSGMALWLGVGIALTACAALVEFLRPSIGAPLRARVARWWIRRVHRLFGTRIIVRGRRPEPPFFLVGNHISWIDFFVTNAVVDAVCVTESIVQSIPLARFLLKGLHLIVIDRVPAELPAVNRRILEAMRRGDSIVMAPEATVSPGLRVRRFHSALLEPAVRLGRPVHYASLTVRTPAGCPLASQAVLSPDTAFCPKDRTEREAEIERRAAERGFLRYFLGLLSLPYHEFIITFGDAPLARPDRKTLARDLRNAVEAIFTPVE